MHTFRLKAGFAVLTVAAAATALLAATAVGGAPAQPAGPTIKMVGGATAGPPAFKGPNSIHRGDRLTILNVSDPSEIGPHTFTLINELPSTKQEAKDCFKSGPCLNGFIKHKVEGEDVNRPNIDVRRHGWDKEFGATGDSQYIGQQGQSFTRTVRASAGKLHYICLVHPEMQGTIRVLPRNG